MVVVRRRSKEAAWYCVTLTGEKNDGEDRDKKIIFQDALLGRCQELQSSLYTINLSSLTVRTILILTTLSEPSHWRPNPRLS